MYPLPNMGRTDFNYIKYNALFEHIWGYIVGLNFEVWFVSCRKKERSTDFFSRTLWNNWKAMYLYPKDVTSWLACAERSVRAVYSITVLQCHCLSAAGNRTVTPLRRKLGVSKFSVK
jgi:hypothetical protein